MSLMTKLTIVIDWRGLWADCRRMSRLIWGWAVRAIAFRPVVGAYVSYFFSFASPLSAVRHFRRDVNQKSSALLAHAR